MYLSRKRYVLSGLHIDVILINIKLTNSYGVSLPALLPAGYTKNYT